MTMVDAFLACKKIMPKWKEMDDSESVFWKFVHVVTLQLDTRPWADKLREGEDHNSTKIASGNLKDTTKRKQNRCKYCKIRMAINEETGRSPHTTFGCSYHNVAVCKKYNCWHRHMSEVNKNHLDKFAI